MMVFPPEDRLPCKTSAFWPDSCKYVSVMKKLRFHLTSDPGWTVRAVLSLVGLCLAVAGCQEKIESASEGQETGIPLAPHPILERDLAAINESGVIRMITRYNSSNYF